MALKENFAGDLECQRCKNPLKFKNVKGFDDEIFDELCRSSCETSNQDDRDILIPIVQKKLENIAMRKVVFPINVNDISSGDFMFIGEIASLPILDSQSFHITDTLQNLISDHTSVDHPFCEECTDDILDLMDTQLKKSEEENDMYASFLEDFKDNKEEDVGKLEEELKKLKMEEAKLEAELRRCETKRETVKKKLEVYEKEAESRAKEEKKKWNEYNRVKRELLEIDDCQHSADNQLMRAQARLNKLANTNVFHATFNIWHSGHFGTINNYRLGRLPSVLVEWSEINAAWGQTVLLLHSLAKKINFTFIRYKLVPCGSQSFLVPLNNKTKYLPLYCLGGAQYVLDHRFDLAMVAFLDCLQQFKERVQASDSSFHLPYGMDKGKIQDKNSGNSYSVKIHFNSYEQWTKALKFMLTNLRWALAWVSSEFQDS